jgi:hypothetical protein
MKKLIPLLLVVLLLTACGTAPQGNPDMQITRGTEPNSTEEVTTTATESTQEELFSFVIGDVTVIPGTPFDATKVSYEDVYEVPSCAGEGTDKMYINSSYEITAFHDGKSEVTYCVTFVTPDAKTPEGLCLGDDMAKAATLYGQYVENGSAWIFTRGNTQLWVIGENDVITSIELRYITE